MTKRNNNQPSPIDNPKASNILVDDEEQVRRMLGRTRRRHGKRDGSFKRSGTSNPNARHDPRPGQDIRADRYSHKPTRLTDIEFRLIKSHTQVGYDILKEIEFPWPIARMVHQHHEKMDGSGYPLGKHVVMHFS